MLTSLKFFVCFFFFIYSLLNSQRRAGRARHILAIIIEKTHFIYQADSYKSFNLQNKYYPRRARARSLAWRRAAGKYKAKSFSASAPKSQIRKNIYKHTNTHITNNECARADLEINMCEDAIKVNYVVLLCDV